ncbi:uncharacterized protein LOC122807756 isoform X2 [Protopterus annectens]|uniref:uncharacterized protein LOC122807756 isoform X2 n=1 Tax=Protopterus annectens TaxID=7888 RepID=UPI001CF9334A|nr:uncharacterized protein LOC122807756 isoform X2 [Protopterus annectens]
MAAHGQRVGVKNLKWRKRESLMMLYVYNQHKSWLEDSQRTVTLIEIWEEIAIKLSKMTGIERTGMQARRHYGELNQWKFKQLQEWLRQVQENPPAPFDEEEKEAIRDMLRRREKRLEIERLRRRKSIS